MTLASKTFRLRAGAAADVPQLVALEVANFTSDRIPARYFHRFLRCGNCVLTVAVSGPDDAPTIAGYALVLFRANTGIGRLYSIVVGQEFRGGGLGVRLLQAVEAAAQGRGKRALRLEVRPDNTTALALYERQGYRVFARQAGFYEDGTDALRLEKQLPQVPRRGA